MSGNLVGGLFSEAESWPLSKVLGFFSAGSVARNHRRGGEPPNQRKLGGLSLTVSGVGYGGVGTHLPTLRCGSVGTGGRARSFHG